MRTIGDTIKILREERRMSQEQLADALNLSRSSKGMYESGKRIPKDDIKELICDYFNVDMNYLHGKTNTRNSTREGEAIKNLVPFEVKEIPLLGKIACGEPIFALFLSVLALFSVVFKNFYTIFYTTKKRGPKTSQSLLSLQFVNLYRNCYNSNRDLDKPENSFENFRFHYLPPSQPEGGLFFYAKIKNPLSGALSILVPSKDQS